MCTHAARVSRVWLSRARVCACARVGLASPLLSPFAMSNGTLLRSSIGFGLIHFVLLLAVYINGHPTVPLLALGYILSVLTSVWNHAVTSEVAKWSDRIVISLTCTANFVFMCFYFDPLPFALVALQCIAIGSYFLSKYLAATSPGATLDKRKRVPGRQQQRGSLFFSSVHANVPHLACHALQTLVHAALLWALASGSITCSAPPPFCPAP